MKKWIIIYGAMIAANIAVALVCPGLVRFSLASALPLASIFALPLLHLRTKIYSGRWGKLYRERRSAEEENEASPGGAVGEVIYHVYNLSAIPFILFFSPTVKRVFFSLQCFVFCAAVIISALLLSAKENRSRKEAEARALDEQRKREELGEWH